MLYIPPVLKKWYPRNLELLNKLVSLQGQELIKQINDDLTIGCQLPFTVPKRELARIIDRAKDYSTHKSYLCFTSAWQPSRYGFPQGSMR